VAPQVQPWVVAWVTSLLTANSAERLQNAKAARKRYELGIHGLQATSAPNPLAAVTGAYPYAMPPYGYAPQPGYPVPYPQGPAHTTAQHLVYTQPHAPQAAQPQVPGATMSAPARAPAPARTPTPARPCLKTLNSRI
jgi:hypothetical protein